MLHKHIIKADNTKVNRILINWLTDTCIKYNIVYYLKQGNKITFCYENNILFPIQKNINKIKKRLIEIKHKLK